MLKSVGRLKVIRFDVDEYLFKSGTVMLNEVVKFNPILAKARVTNQDMLILKWRVNYISDLTKGIEHIGLLAEIQSIIEPVSKTADYELTKQFIANSFMNIEIYLQDNLPKNAIVLSRKGLPYDKFANHVLDYVEQAGLY